MAWRAPDLAFSIWPEARQGTQQRGFTTARRALDQQCLTGVQAQVKVSDKGMPVWPKYLQISDFQRMLLSLGGDTRQGARLLVGIKKTGQTVEGGPVLSERIVRFAEERQ